VVLLAPRQTGRGVTAAFRSFHFSHSAAPGDMLGWNVSDQRRHPLPDDAGFFQAVIGDGRPLVALTGLALIGSGLFALFLSATGHFLPHDEQFLGMTAKELCALHGCRIVHFMYHDRASFGGALVAVGTLYLWLVQFPLRRGEAWSWWTLLFSGVAGFASFLAYLGYGYLDTWHGAATLVLLPCFAFGMLRSYRVALDPPKTLRTLLRPSRLIRFSTRYDVGRACLLATALIVTVAGLVILSVGMTSVFVPQDLEFLGVDPAELHAINPRLVPLIAHDRAGFGGGLCCVGLTVFACVWCGRPSRNLWQALAISGTIGFGTAIGVHPLISYNDAVHVGPAAAGALLFWLGLGLCGGRGPCQQRPPRPHYRPCHQRGERQTPAGRRSPFGSVVEGVHVLQIPPHRACIGSCFCRRVDRSGGPCGNDLLGRRRPNEQLGRCGQLVDG
jgi:hypothetical protein